ncbi:hypothetical protein K458DRAFT_427401 [Lentithecium fluviatile CBS 122367]|uniref:DUF1996 domain-containing protein n=1 Tax=Lentithecium fluviatile CBS 122367 TaxID=1168545 RepID=A0A6G1JF39_9PLEO|nr:hypothetical protein K458DRAFT_427401 [Lentithecium fluviatile CBS 122367]
MLNLFALTAGLAATASAFDCHGPYFSFYNRAGPAMSFQRLDPALFPGQQSPHLHSFDGGNGLAADMTFETTQESTCTTARIKPDKSLYWRPTLFWNGNNTGFYKVPDKFLKIYYKFGDSGNAKANVSEFPENFQMIAGDPFKRADGDNPAGIKWACLGDNYSRIDAKGFPKGFTSCKEGLTSEITFPSCWNGKEIDPKSPSAHMTWPTNSGNGLDACPDGFKVARFPTIFIEFWYDVSGFDGQYSADDVPWSLANGDPTGFGFHADFRNGWEKGVLAKATADDGYCNCGCGCGNDQMKECFGADNVNDDNDAEFKSCTAKQAFGEDKTLGIDKLPGCNPLQAGPEKATQATGPDCTAAAAAPSSGASKTSAADASTTDASVSESGTEPAATTAKATSTGKASEADAESTDVPTISQTLKNKGKTTVGKAGDGDVATTATKTKESEGYNTALPSLSLASTTASPANTAGGEDDICPEPTTITITPTVYVTAGAVGPNATSCDAGTVYATVTDTTTVTISAASYMVRHKRHGDLHHKH